MKIKDSGELIGLITKALSERFAEDPSKPGILIAHIPGGLADVGMADAAINVRDGVAGAVLGRVVARGLVVAFDPETARISPHRRPSASDAPLPTPATPPDAAAFYVAAQRYTAPYGLGKEIVAKAYAADLDDALILVANAVCPTTEAQQDLEAFLREK